MKQYTKSGLWTLFLICAFPLHIWTFILAFRDFSWVSERTNSWDAVGVVSYGLLFASKKWEEKQRITLLGTLVTIASLWAIAGYLFFMLNASVPSGFILFASGLAHPLRFLYAVALVLVGITVTIPVFFILRSKKFMQGLQGLFERLSLLTMFYLFFDFVGLVIVIVRNVS